MSQSRHIQGLETYALHDLHCHGVILSCSAWPVSLVTGLQREAHAYQCGFALSADTQDVVFRQIRKQELNESTECRSA